jgi:hypothetical protein
VLEQVVFVHRRLSVSVTAGVKVKPDKPRRCGGDARITDRAGRRRDPFAEPGCRDVVPPLPAG